METLLIKPNTTFAVTAEAIIQPERLDLFLMRQLPAYSRNFFQKLIDAAQVSVNGKIVTKSSSLIKTGDNLTVHFPAVRALEARKELSKDLKVEVLFEHEHFLIVSKPADLIVHPPSNRHDGVTLVDWLITYFHELKDVGSSERPGIVHRLDKDTSGILIIPRTNYALAIFGDIFKDRRINKTYLAVVKGHPPLSGTIDFAIDRHPVERTKMTHESYRGRQALTHFKTLEYFDDAALVEVHPITGRTHQIRVHLAGLGYPIIGDAVYGSKSKLINRQALHAHHIAFTFEDHDYSFSKEIPDDFQKLIEILRNIVNNSKK